MMWSVFVAFGLGLGVGLLVKERTHIIHDYPWSAYLSVPPVLVASWYFIGTWIQYESYVLASENPHSMWYSLYYFFNQYPHESAFWLTLIGMVLVWVWGTIVPTIKRGTRFWLILGAILLVVFLYSYGGPQVESGVSQFAALAIMAAVLYGAFKVPRKKKDEGKKADH